MTKKNPFGFDLGSLGKAMQDLKNVYSEGFGAINQAEEEVAENLEPNHKIKIEVQLSANVENHVYKINTDLEFVADLDSILNSETGDIASLLQNLDVDLDQNESKQVIEQLGKPRCIGILKKFKIKEIELHSEQGKIKEGINPQGTILITLENKKINLAFESVFALPKLQTEQTLYYALPSQEKMQKNIVLETNNLDQKTSFQWTEKDKDNLKITGSVKISKLET